MTTKATISIDDAIAAVQAIYDNPPSHDPGVCLHMAIQAIEGLPHITPHGETGDGWQREGAPLEHFVLVRPVGFHGATGKPFTPTVAQLLDWSGARRWYTPMNEIEPIEFGETIPQEDLPEFLKFHGTEWRYLPDDTALQRNPNEALLSEVLEIIAKHQSAFERLPALWNASAAMYREVAALSPKATKGDGV